MNKDGATPLLMAVHNGHTEVVKLLVTMGGVAPDENVIRVAKEKGNEEIIQLLSGKHANQNTTSSSQSLSSVVGQGFYSNKQSNTKPASMSTLTPEFK